MDYLIFKEIFSWAMKWSVVGQAGLFFAGPGIWLLLALVCYLWLGHRKTGVIRQEWFLRLVGSAAVAYAINALIGLFYFRPRPFVTHQLKPLIDILATHKSFPSDHTTIAFCLAVGVMFVSRRWGILAVGWASLIGLGRILVGVHYPVDVLAGAVIGSMIALSVHGFFNRRAVNLTGQVVKGTGQGRQLGMPTANFDTRGGHDLSPGNYAVWVLDGSGRLPGMAIIDYDHDASLPRKKFKIRVHVIGFDGDLLDQNMVLRLVGQINELAVTDNLTDLGKLLRRDCLLAKQRLQEDLRRNLF